jgi:putative tricarboxylic transport membrane protein
MTQRSAERLFIAILGVIGAVLIHQGLGLRYWTLTGPGPGFFPVWIGGLLLLAALAGLLRLGRAPSAGLNPGSDHALAIDSAPGPAQPFFEEAEGARRVGLMLLAFMLLWLGMLAVGFRLAVFVFVLTAPSLIERQSWPLRIVLAGLFGVLVPWVFERYLLVDLPSPAFDVLRTLGF